jgi:hypothetical protein
VPEIVIRPILMAAFSVNHRVPSGPAVIPQGLLLGVGTEYSVMVPFVVTRLILLTLFCCSANHRAPSGPAVMPFGRQFGVGIGNSVMTPVVVIGRCCCRTIP